MTVYEMPFTQYLQPNGRKREVFTTTDDGDLYNKYRHIADLNTHGRSIEFAVEVLSTGMVSFTIEEDLGDKTVAYAVELCENGPPVTSAVRSLIERAHAVLFTR